MNSIGAVLQIYLTKSQTIRPRPSDFEATGNISIAQQ